MADLIPDAVLHVIDGAGHFPTLEAPDTVTETL
ncbi:alpha/beta fold hydrolase [Ruegeria conchae]